MKKHMFLLFSLVLLAVSIYTVNTYNSTGAKANSASDSSNSSKKAQTSTDTSGNVAEDAAVFGKAADFTLVDLEGNEVSLSDFKGKKVF